MRFYKNSKYIDITIEIEGPLIRKFYKIINGEIDFKTLDALI